MAIHAPDKTILTKLMITQFIRYWQEFAIKRRCADTHTLVLTYDDGPGTHMTPQILSLLKTYRVKGTFFLLGFRAAKISQIVEQILADGHEIGCHSQNHLNAWKCWPWQSVKDVKVGFMMLSPWLPERTLFRPPNGKLTLGTWWTVLRRGGRFGWWTIDSGDTHRELPQPQQTVEAVKRAGGGVVLMHDFDRTPERQDYVLRTTELLLQWAKTEGFTVRPLGELLDLCDHDKHS